MKTQSEVQEALDKVDTVAATQFRNMTYEQGVEEALMWILGDISDEEFTFGKQS